MKPIQPVLQATAQRRRTLQCLYIAYAALYAVAFALVFASYAGALAVAACNAAFYFLYLRRQVLQYQHDFVAHTLEFGFCQDFEQLEYTGKQEFTGRELLQLALLPLEGAPGEVLCKEGFHGRRGDVALRGNEVSLHFKKAQPAGQKPQYQFWNGTLLEFRWQGTGPAPFTLLSRGLAQPEVCALLAARYGAAQAQPASPALEERFLLFQPDGAPLPGDALAKRLKRLAQEVPGEFGLCLAPGRLAVFFNGQFYAQRILVKYPVSEKALRGERLPGRAALLDLAAHCAAQRP